jgi:erythromycin 3''-O-methyltransferase
MPATPTPAELLHQGGTPGAWGNLGLWQDGADYASACAALAKAVGRASGLQAGERVLSVACGAGPELLLWLHDFGAAQAVGVEADACALAAARHLCAGQAVVLHAGDGTALDSLGLPAGGFDRVVCVDAAYHLRPRTAFLRSAWALLRPGGGLACTDLVLDRPAAGFSVLRAAAGLCGLDIDDLAPSSVQLQRLQLAGYVDARLERLDGQVLDGFADFVRRQEGRLGRRAWSRHWRRAAITARLIGPCRAAGLGYAMLSARKPFTTAAASMAAATAQAERTALSSSGTPGCA